MQVAIFSVRPYVFREYKAFYLIFLSFHSVHGHDRQTGNSYLKSCRWQHDYFKSSIIRTSDGSDTCPFFYLTCVSRVSADAAILTFRQSVLCCTFLRVIFP